MNQQLIIGIDCGGSKTLAYAGTKDGKIVGKGTGGASNPLSVGTERALENIITAIRNAAFEIGIPEIISLYIGTAGGKPQVLQEMYKAISLTTMLHITGPITVDHDLRIALYSGIPDGKGIVIIAGTGSAAFGIDKKGKEVIVSGWSHLLGEAGGYELGIKAIIAATRSVDGRGEKTILEKAVKKKFALNDFEEISSIIKTSSIDSPTIASIAPYVSKAAIAGDKVAIRIMEEMIDEMDCTVRAAIKRVGIEENPKVLLVGSIFKMKYPIIEKLQQRFKEWNKNVQIVFPQEHPAMTAFKLAKEQIEN